MWGISIHKKSPFENSLFSLPTTTFEIMFNKFMTKYIQTLWPSMNSKQREEIKNNAFIDCKAGRCMLCGTNDEIFGILPKYVMPYNSNNINLPHLLEHIAKKHQSFSSWTYNKFVYVKYI